MRKAGREIISTQYTDGVGDKAVTVTDGVLQSFTDIDAIVCCADDVALGASRAIKQAGRDGDGIIVCGFDGISSGVQAVVDGEISCTVAQDPYNMGYQCVKSLLDVVEGEKLDDFIDTGCKVITPDNAQEYLDKLKSRYKHYFLIPHSHSRAWENAPTFFPFFMSFKTYSLIFLFSLF